MKTETFTVALDATEGVSGLVYFADDEAWSNRTLVLAHGAGAGQRHPFMVEFARGLSDRGVHVVTFDFPYVAQGRRAPDRRDRLVACWRSVVEAVREHVDLRETTLFIGGKSMGGRMATYLAVEMSTEDRARFAGVVLLGYPQHPPGRPDRLRADHLGGVGIPMLFVQGSRDSFGTPDELHAQLTGIPDVEVHPVQGGDHSFKVLKRTGRTAADVHAEILDAIVAWMPRTVPSQVRSHP